MFGCQLIFSLSAAGVQPKVLRELLYSRSSFVGVVFLASVSQALPRFAFPTRFGLQFLRHCQVSSHFPVRVDVPPFSYLIPPATRIKARVNKFNEFYQNLIDSVPTEFQNW
jgi:hypothetical protein